jgi:hypothetical protein
MVSIFAYVDLAIGGAYPAEARVVQKIRETMAQKAQELKQRATLATETGQIEVYRKALFMRGDRKSFVCSIRV